MDHLITSIVCDEKKAILFTLSTLTYGLFLLVRNEFYMKNRYTLSESTFIQEIIG